jgi:cell wall-associated NlpC family hydrolase
LRFILPAFVPENNMKPPFAALAFTTALVLLTGCAGLRSGPARSTSDQVAAVSNALRLIQARFAPDPHLAIFRVGAERRAGGLALTGYVDSAEAKHAALEAAKQPAPAIADLIQVLPETELAETPWALVCLSVANGREQPQNSAEMGTQVLMGNPVRVWKRSRIWYLVQTADRYVCWMEKGSFELCTAAKVETWNNSPLLIVTAFEERVLETPRAGSQPVTDVVMGGLLKKTGEEGAWFKVELPDHRTGFLPKTAAEDYAAWKQARRATPENIERTARSLLGRPYLWGANSPKGLDCSGFNKFVFFLNGIDLDRNASHQARQGIEVPLDTDFGRLKKGDLLFFGSRGSDRRPGRISHTGIYLGDKLFIHSSERVRINSLDPASPLRDEQRIRGLVSARRILPESADGL